MNITHYRVNFIHLASGTIHNGIWFPADEEGAKHIILEIEKPMKGYGFWDVETY
jgi:hypothetical protein